MKIIFSPYYDQQTYSGTMVGTVLGEKILGMRGLLSELELRTGMTGAEKSQFDRVLAYYLAIQQAEKDRTHFFSESFKKDELNVAAELLRWRDALKMAGWNASVADSSQGMYKFRDLADVEEYFNCQGEADRWHALLDSPASLSGTSIDIRVPRSALDKVIVDVLERSGAEICFTSPESGSELKLDASVKVISFRNRVQAYRWVAGQYFPKETLLVNKDNKAFNDVLRAADMPLVKADYSDSNPLTIQLFKIGMSLFNPVRDIRALVSYLQIPINPIPSASRHAVLKYLLKMGGTGKDWTTLLEENQVGSAVLARFDCEEEIIECKTIEEYLHELTAWSSRYRHGLEVNEKDPDIVQQLSALSQMCDALSKMISCASISRIEYGRLKKWVEAIYSSFSFEEAKAQVGSYDIISDVKAIVNGPSTLVWLDCNSGGKTKYPLYFLSPDELRWLESKGIHPVREDVFAKASNIAMKEALGKVRNEIILLTSQIAYGNRCDEHMILTEIKASGIPYWNEEDPQMPAGVELKAEKIQEPKPEIELEHGIEVPERPAGESYSSLNTLIQRPIDYVLDYILELREVDFGQVEDMAIVKGNVAHAVIGYCSQMFKENESIIFDGSALDELIDRIAKEQGQVLYYDSIQYGSFKLKLKKSISCLFRQISEHKLTIVGNELPYEVDLPPTKEGLTIGHFNARVDLLLQDEHGDFVILDLKWSESGIYKEKVREQKDLQLVMYRETIKAAYPGKKVLGCAFYVIPQYKFMTNNKYFSSWNDTVYYDIAEDEIVDVYGEATRSFHFRKDQLERGLLENGEGLEILSSNFEYVSVMDDDYPLYPLDHKYCEEELKDEAYGGKNFVLKGRAL